MRFFLKAIGITLLLFTLFFMNRVLASQEDELSRALENGEVIRLHILANSDSPNDQQIKLAVRDAILLAFAADFDGLSDSNEIYRLLLTKAQDMAMAANAVLTDNGFAYGASARVGILSLPEKAYGDTVLPAGEYRGLQLILGQGEGQNWFCVLFPSLCMTSTEQAEPLRLWSLDVLRLWIGQW